MPNAWLNQGLGISTFWGELMCQMLLSKSSHNLSNIIFAMRKLRRLRWGQLSVKQLTNTSVLNFKAHIFLLSHHASKYSSPVISYRHILKYKLQLRIWTPWKKGKLTNFTHVFHWLRDCYRSLNIWVTFNFLWSRLSSGDIPWS